MNEIVLNANSLRRSQKASKRTHSRETWDRNAVKSVRAKMDVTFVAGGISGRVLCLGGGAAWRFRGSQIAIFAPRECSSWLRRSLRAVAPPPNEKLQSATQTGRV